MGTMELNNHNKHLIAPEDVYKCLNCDKFFSCMDYLHCYEREMWKTSVEKFNAHSMIKKVLDESYQKYNFKLLHTEAGQLKEVITSVQESQTWMNT